MERVSGSAEAILAVELLQGTAYSQSRVSIDLPLWSYGERGFNTIISKGGDSLEKMYSVKEKGGIQIKLKRQKRTLHFRFLNHDILKYVCCIPFFITSFYFSINLQFQILF